MGHISVYKKVEYHKAPKVKKKPESETHSVDVETTDKVELQLDESEKLSL